jgi:isochorismate hydrolase
MDSELRRSYLQLGPALLLSCEQGIMTDFKFDPRRTALLNIDMQNCFVENSPVAAPRGREILPRINKLAEICRKRGALVIHTLHLVRPDGSNTGVMGLIIPAIAAGLINKGNKQAELHPDVVVGKNDIILEKPRYGAFHGTDLDSFSAIAASTRSSSPGSAPMSAAKPPRAKPT